MKKRIEINLADDEVKFIEWMAERDGQTFKKEMETMFYLQLREDMEYYKEEMEQEVSDG